MKKNLLKIICIALISTLCISNAFAQAKTVKVETQLPTSNLTDATCCNSKVSRAAWDILWNFDLTVLHGASGSYAPFLWEDKLYISEWNGTKGQVFRYAKSGANWVVDGSITIPGIAGSYNFEGFTTDGSFIYGVTEGANIYKIDPATWTVAGTIPVSGQPIAVAYDSENDGFWIASWQATTATLVSRTGATMATLTGGISISGLAWENTSDGTPYLWDYSGSSGPNLHRWNCSTGVFTQNAHVTTDVPGLNTSGAGAGIFYGLYAPESKMVLLCVNEGGTGINNRCFCYEMGDHSSVDPCPAVTNVTATLFESNKVKVDWVAPATAPTEYKIYQGTTSVATIPVGTTTWTSGALASGTYTFSVEAIYDGTCSPVKVAATPVEIKTCDKKVTDLAVAYAADCNKATITWTAPAKNRSEVIYDNGPFITHPGQGAGGADVAAFGTSGENNYGGNAGASYPYYIADDFVLTNHTVIESIVFHTYQTNSGNTSTITNVYVQIWNGAPNAGGTVIWGDLTTNRMSNNVFSNIYRVNYTDLTNTARPLMKITANIDGLALEPGTYWVQVGFTGTVASGPWVNPVTVLGQLPNGNGIQWNYATSVWQPWTDNGGTDLQLALPFVVNGAGGPAPDPEYNVYRDGNKVAGPITEVTFEDTSFDKTQPHTWSVAVVCSNGGDGDWVNADKDACSAVVVCNPATNLNVAFAVDCNSAELTWTAAEGGTLYNVYRGGVKLTEEPVSAVTYTDTTIISGTSYTWYVKTVCGSVESDSVSKTGICEGIREFALSSFTIVPNPATDHIIVSTPVNVNFNTIEIVNFLGQTVVSQPVDKNSVRVDVSNLTSGVYFVRIASEKETSVKKFVKK